MIITHRKTFVTNVKMIALAEDWHLETDSIFTGTDLLSKANLTSSAGRVPGKRRINKAQTWPSVTVRVRERHKQ